LTTLHNGVLCQGQHIFFLAKGKLPIRLRLLQWLTMFFSYYIFLKDKCNEYATIGKELLFTKSGYGLEN